MIIRKHKSGNLRRSGGSLIELALLLPALFMLTFGLVDYSYYFYLRSNFQAAASAAVRAATPSSGTNTTATTIVSTMMTASGIPSSKYSVTFSPSNVGTATAGTIISVTVSGTWGTAGTRVLGTAFGGISSSKTIVGAASAVKE